jgi:hypothetical protein
MIGTDWRWRQDDSIAAGDVGRVHTNTGRACAGRSSSPCTRVRPRSPARAGPHRTSRLLGYNGTSCACLLMRHDAGTRSTDAKMSLFPSASPQGAEKMTTCTGGRRRGDSGASTANGTFLQRRRPARERRWADPVRHAHELGWREVDAPFVVDWGAETRIRVQGSVAARDFLGRPIYSADEMTSWMSRRCGRPGRPGVGVKDDCDAQRWRLIRGEAPCPPAAKDTRVPRGVPKRGRRVRGSPTPSC